MWPAAEQVVPGRVEWHVLASVQTGPAELAADILLVAAAIAYMAAVGQLRRRGEGWPPWRSVAFLGGLLVLWVAVGSGLAAYDDTNPPLHVIEHVLVMMVAPAALVLGRPLTLAEQALSGASGRAIGVITGSWAWRRASGPWGWAVYYLSMPAYFLTGLYALTVRSHAALDLVEVGFLVIGCLYWNAMLVVGTDPGTATPVDDSGTGVAVPLSGQPARFVAVLVGMPVETATGVAMVLWPAALASGLTVAQTHVAGLVLWLACMVTSGVALVALILQWAAADNRRVRELDDVLDGMEGAFGTEDAALAASPSPSSPPPVAPA